MAGVVVLRVPTEAVDHLIDDGIHVADEFRGPDAWVAAVGQAVTILTGGLSVGANLTTILVAKDSIQLFGQKFRNWLAGRTPDEVGTSLELQIKKSHQGDSWKTQIAVTHTGTNKTDLDVGALVTLIESALHPSDETETRRRRLD